MLRSPSNVTLALALLLCGCRPAAPPAQGILAAPDAAVDSRGPVPEAAVDLGRAPDAFLAPDALADAGVIADAEVSGSCAGSGAVVKALAPKLFSRGEDPSADPACTA